MLLIALATSSVRRARSQAMTGAKAVVTEFVLTRTGLALVWIHRGLAAGREVLFTAEGALFGSRISLLWSAGWCDDGDICLLIT